MTRKLPALALLIALCILHPFALRKAGDATGSSKAEEIAFVLPAPVLKIITLEFDGLASDFMFLKSSVFLGGALKRNERPKVKEWEWRWLSNVLNVSAGLDPYFFDLYYFANAHLTWDGNLVAETNALLEKGSGFRDWDWRIPFYIGFNKFYFLDENEEAGKHLMEAARRPGAPELLASLASKLVYKGGRTENAISFLEEIIRKTEDEDTKKRYEQRLGTLRGIDLLEKAVSSFRQKYGRMPQNIDELTAKKTISKIPEDPSGYGYFIDKDGAVKSANESMLLPSRNQPAVYSPFRLFQ